MTTKKLIKILTHCLILTLLFAVAGCSSFKGTELVYEKIPTSSLNKTIEYGVYTPPNWSIKERLPLVLFLHGAKDDHNTLEQYQIHRYFDSQINAKKMPRFILVTPNGDSGFWENWHDGSYNYRDWVMQDILPKVQRDYNTLNCPQNCSLMGISMGGLGALRIANLNKESFASVSVISASIIGNEDNKNSKGLFLVRLFFPLKRIYGPQFSDRDESKSIQNVWTNKKNQDLQKIRLQLIWGDKDHDNIIRANQRFHMLLMNSGREHDFYIYQGGHKWLDWKPQFSRAINFLVK